MFNFLLGALFMWIQVSMHKVLTKRDKVKLWLSHLLVLIVNIIVIFSIAWAYASILEGEIQAAMMGLTIFGGGIGIIIASISKRIILIEDKQSIEGEKKG